MLASLPAADARYFGMVEELLRLLMSPFRLVPLPPAVQPSTTGERASASKAYVAPLLCQAGHADVTVCCCCVKVLHLLFGRAQRMVM